MSTWRDVNVTCWRVPHVTSRHDPWWEGRSYLLCHMKDDGGGVLSQLRWSPDHAWNYPCYLSSLADKKLTTLEIWDGSIFLCRSRASDWFVELIVLLPPACWTWTLSLLSTPDFWAKGARPDISPKFSSVSGGPEEWVWLVVRDMDMVGLLLYYRCHHRGHLGSGLVVGTSGTAELSRL